MMMRQAGASLLRIRRRTLWCRSCSSSSSSGSSSRCGRAGRGRIRCGQEQQPLPSIRRHISGSSVKWDHPQHAPPLRTMVGDEKGGAAAEAAAGGGEGAGCMHVPEVSEEERQRRESEANPNVSFSRNSVPKTVDKSHFDFARMGRFNMHAPLAGVPPPKPLSELEEPETHLSTLSNGLRVASHETYGQLCSFGVLMHAGSKFETDENTGVSHMMEAMAFKSTRSRSAADLMTEVERLGGFVSASGSRDELLLCVDVLRENLEPAMELLAESVLCPVLSEEELAEQKSNIMAYSGDIGGDAILREAIMAAAYPNQPLGRPHLCPPERLADLQVSHLHEYRSDFFFAPNMVLAAAGVQHDEFMSLADKYLSALPPRGRMGDKLIIPESTYVGGQKMVERGNPDKDMEDQHFVRVALAFECGGWTHEDLVPTCVLQVLLGGGDAFSAGGPGKGMYSRLYTDVLNKYNWVEAAEAFTCINVDKGLFGMSGIVPTPAIGHPGQRMMGGAREMLHIFLQHFDELAREPVKHAQLERAKSMLKCNILTQLESRVVLFEDIGRQILAYGKREPVEDVCRKIEETTAEDIMRVGRRLMASPPTVAAVGSNLSGVPDVGEVRSWFQQQQQQQQQQ